MKHQEANTGYFLPFFTHAAHPENVFYIEHFTYNDFMVKETNLKAQH